MAEGAVEIGRSAGDAGRDEGENNPADSGEGMESIGDDGDRAGVDADAEFDQKIDAGQPG